MFKLCCQRKTSESTAFWCAKCYKYLSRHISEDVCFKQTLSNKTYRSRNQDFWHETGVQTKLFSFSLALDEPSGLLKTVGWMSCGKLGTSRNRLGIVVESKRCACFCGRECSASICIGAFFLDFQVIIGWNLLIIVIRSLLITLIQQQSSVSLVKFLKMANDMKDSRQENVVLSPSCFIQSVD